MLPDSIIYDCSNSLLELENFLKHADIELYTGLHHGHKESSSIGAHVRHIIEFYQQFFRTVDSGHINYDHRDRSVKIEMNKLEAIKEIMQVINSMNQFEVNPNKSIIVTSNFRSCQSNIERELMYLNEHTVHHQALIRILAELSGHRFDSNFGITKSTIASQITE